MKRLSNAQYVYSGQKMIYGENYGKLYAFTYVGDKPEAPVSLELYECVRLDMGYGVTVTFSRQKHCIYVNTKTLNKLVDLQGIDGAETFNRLSKDLVEVGIREKNWLTEEKLEEYGLAVGMAV